MMILTSKEYFSAVNPFKEDENGKLHAHATTKGLQKVVDCFHKLRFERGCQ